MSDANANFADLTVYYDGSCPLCRTEMGHLMACNHAGRVHFIDIAGPGFDAAQVGKPRADLMEALHVQAADGQWRIGIPAIEAVYAAVGLHRVARSLRHPLLAPLATQLYPWLARHRYRLPRWLVTLLVDSPLRRAATRAARARCTADCRLP